MKRFLFTSILIIIFAKGINAQDSLSLPPILEFADGKPIKTKRQWEKRRKEILHIFEQEMYGVAPPVPRKVKFSIQSESNNEFKGKATKRRVNLYLNNLDNPIELLIYYPNNVAKKVPAFLGYNFWGNYTVVDNLEVPLTKKWVRNVGVIQNNLANENLRGSMRRRWPIEKIIDSGFALVTLYYGDIEPDYNSGVKEGVRALYQEPRYTWGAISAWAWGMSYVMNYIELDKRINEKQVTVIGHSRLGKTALWAGATDKRFAMVVANNSGCTGAALSRRKFGERFDILIKVRPYWYSPNFTKYSGKEEELAVDQHQLIALIAPRLVYVASAHLDKYADPEGEFLGLYYGSEVFQLFNLKGLDINKMPEVNTPYFSGQVAYHLREGKHDITEYDWLQYLKFADLHFRR